MVLKNLWFVLKTIPVANKKARHHLEKAVELSRSYDMPLCMAKSYHRLALLSMAGKRRGEAVAHLESALEAAREAESEAIANIIRADLDSAKAQTTL